MFTYDVHFLNINSLAECGYQIQSLHVPCGSKIPKMEFYSLKFYLYSAKQLPHIVR